MTTFDLRVFDPTVLDALSNLNQGDEIILLTWLNRADRSLLRVHPRGDLSRSQQGVFSTLAASPNPIGLHRVEITSIVGAREVRSLEALDGTPILDMKSTFGDVASR